MARLNENLPQQSESIEALKRRFQRQNRDLARNNANQSSMIQSLQNELMEMGAENLRLNAEVIHLKSQIDLMKGKSYMDDIARTKQMMQDKLEELSLLVNGLEITRNRKTIHGKRSPRAIKPDESMRGRPENLLPDIIEHRNSQNFEEIFRANSGINAQEPDMLQPAIITAADKTSERALNPMLDVRPRRRRDTADIEASTTNSPTNLDTLSGQAKRKLQVLNLPSGTHSNVQENFDIIGGDHIDEEKIQSHDKKLPEGASDDWDVFGSVHTKKEISSSTEDENGSQKPSSTIKNVLSKLEGHITPASPRRALEPKNTNTDISSSPRKLGYSKSHDNEKKVTFEPSSEPINCNIGLSDDMENKVRSSKIVEKEKNKNQRQITKTKSQRLSGSQRESLSREEAPDGETGVSTERARRTRGTAVNYALPPLNKKLRRETEALVDAVESNIKGKKQPSDKSRDRTPNVQIKQEQEDNVIDIGDKPLFGVDVDPLKRTVRKKSMALDSDSRRSSLAEAGNRIDESEKASIMGGEARRLSSDGKTLISRKRRTSGLYDALPDGFVENNEGTDKNRMDAARRDIHGYTLVPSPEPNRDYVKSSSSTGSQKPFSTLSSSTSRRKTTLRVMPDDANIAQDKKHSSAGIVPASELLEVRRQRRATLAVTCAADGVNSNIGSGIGSRKDDGKIFKVVPSLDPESDNSKSSRRKSMLV